MRRCVRLRAGVAAAAAARVALRGHGSSGMVPINDSTATPSAASACANDTLALVEERQMAVVEATVERHTVDLVYELKRHHALADATRRFTSDATELLDWLARQRRLLDSTFFAGFAPLATAAPGTGRAASTAQDVGVGRCLQLT